MLLFYCVTFGRLHLIDLSRLLIPGMFWRTTGLETARQVRDLVRRLLVRDTTQRLGCMKRAGLDIMDHKFYQTLDWEEVLERKLEPPLRPIIYNIG